MTCEIIQYRVIKSGTHYLLLCYQDTQDNINFHENLSSRVKVIRSDKRKAHASMRAHTQ
jgi:hypothetical protein